MPLPNVEHPHSVISRELRYRFRELNDLREIRKSEISVLSGIGNGKKRASAYKSMLGDIFSTIPYLSAGRREKERVISNDIELYKQLKNSISKDLAKKEFEEAVALSQPDIRVLGGNEEKRKLKKVKRVEN